MYTKDVIRLRDIRIFTEETGKFPTFKEICSLCNFRSTNSATKLLKRLIAEGYIVKDKGYKLGEKYTNKVFK
jgi:SOS-response transcriptional repressor LexA